MPLSTTPLSDSVTDKRVERAFRDHPSFERTEGDESSDETETTDRTEFEITFTPFEGAVGVANGPSRNDDADRREYRVVVRVPTLDAVVEGETVAPVVQDGWFDTLDRRLADAHAVADTEAATAPTVEREGETVVVTATFERDDPERAAEDAKAIAEYVEGTWVQGLIPGYDYREPASSFRERATQNYEDGGSRGPR